MYDKSALQAPRVGVIGVGSIGLPMAMRLLDARGALPFYSRSSRPALVAAGASAAATPRELAEQSDMILVMLPDLPQLEENLDGPDGLLMSTSDLLLMIGSTSSAPAVRALAQRLTEQTKGRVRVVDCPVSGGEDGARAWTLSIMLGGEADLVDAAARVLEPCGNCVHLGPLGSGEVAKACNQIVVAATILALGEASVLADRSGIDVGRLWDLLAVGYAGSNLLKSRRDKLVTCDDSPTGIVEYMVKDLGFAADAATATGTNTVLLPTLRTVFGEIVALGLGKRDITVTRRFVAEHSGPPHPGPIPQSMVGTH